MWFTRVHIIIMTIAIVSTEVYFTSK